METSNPSRFCLNLRFNDKIEDPRKFNHIEDMKIYGTITGDLAHIFKIFMPWSVHKTYGFSIRSRIVFSTDTR